MEISVIICTYNRCESLKDTLESLLLQNVEGVDFEILIIDNNSKDRTRDVVESYAPRFNGKLEYFFESKQGLSCARNRGIRESRGSIVVFTDDDCLPHDQRLLRMRNEFKTDAALDAVLGGAVLESGERLYGREGDSFIKGKGMNMAFRRRVFEKVGMFDEFLGVGSIGCSAEDTDLIYRAMNQKMNIRICEEISVVHKHRISKEQERRFLRRDCKGYMVFLLKYILRKRDLFALKKMYWFVKDISRKRPLELRYSLLSAIFSGVMKGLFIWCFLAPGKSLCRK